MFGLQSFCANKRSAILKMVLAGSAIISASRISSKLHHADYIFTQLDALNAALLQTDEFHENEFTLSVSNSMFLKL